MVTCVTWLMAGLLAQTPAPIETKLPGDAPAKLETRLDKLKAENTDVPARTMIEVRNEMGNRFRLVEARFIVDGVEVGKRAAKPGEELERKFGPLEATLPAGQHVLTAELVFEGRNAGPFRYLDDIRYRVESTIPFESGHLVGPATVEVVARERPGANVPFERKPMLVVTATNRPEAPAATARTGPAPTKSPATTQPGTTPANVAAPEDNRVKPASTTTR